MDVDYDDSGSGEPVVCIHGALLADAFRPLLGSRSLAGYRRIAYRRRGYGPDGGAPASSVDEHAHDCARMLGRLGISHAHVVGHSFGGAVALQLALSAPGLVGSLALLEPALLVGASADAYRAGLGESIRRYRTDDVAIVIDEFLRPRCPDYAAVLERQLPGALADARRDAHACFDGDLPAALGFDFGEAEARRIVAPALVVLGRESAALHPRFRATYDLLLHWLPAAEGAVVAGATHFLQLERPHDIAELLAGFYARHPLGHV